MKQIYLRLMILLSAVLMLSGIQAKKVHTLGDSTMAPYEESATNTRGWGMYFGNFLTGGWTSVNYAKGGRDSRGGFNELWQNAKNNVEAGDYVLIQFAHNDEKYNGMDNLELQAYYTAQGDASNAAAVKNDGRGTVPSTTYKECLKQIIDAVKAKGATPVLVSAVCRCYFNGSTITRAGRHDLGDKYDAIVDGTIKTGLKVAADDHTMDYSYQMQQLAIAEGVTFIDMTTATKNLYENYGSYDKCYAALFDKGGEKDNTHYNLTGALMAARLCAQLMKEQGILADNIEIPTDLSIAPSAADMGDVYVGQSASKELTLTGLGLEPATGNITITASEGILLSVDKQNWQDALEVSCEGGTVIKTFYAKVAATAVGKFNGTVTATFGNKQIVATVTMNAVELSGVNITGSITYKLDKGGLNQGDDAIMEPNELSAGFAAKKWSAGSALTVENTKSYRGASGEANIPQTRIYNGTTGSFPSSAGADNTLTLNLTPEDGFSFVPTKLSFQAARYGTDGGTITASVDAGETHADLVTNAGVNRDGKSLTIASFSEEITGITATADNPLKVNFSFLGLGKTKEMGLSNVVIEGTLVGAATQVTKYVLTTVVEPAEAGSISRDPDMEQYKEGSVVKLKATKNFGYRFKEWQNDNGTVVSTNAETTVTMDGEKTVKAVFESVPVYKATTNVTNDSDRELGSITLSPNDHDGQYEAGTKITATANESKILKFLSWTDENENGNASATRDLTVNGDMTLVANFEVQDFVAVFDASTTANYAYATTAGYPFAADVTWDSERNAKSCIVKVSDGSLCYTQDGGTPVVRNRQGVVLSGINGLYQNGYRSTDIAFQYQFSTKGFTCVTFVADMAAKNAATKNWKALISTDGTNYVALGEPWSMTANVMMPLSLELPADAVDKDLVYIRITGDGTEILSDRYTFDKQFDGLDYTSNSECGVGNVFVLGTAAVIADEEAPVITGTVPADNSTGVSATGHITVSFNERIEAVAGAPAATLTAIGGSPVSITPSWSNRSVSFDYSALDYDTDYTFMLPANFVQDLSGNKLAEAKSIVFTTMQRPTIAKVMYDFIVPDDGTITEALTAANSRTDKTTRYRVFIKNSPQPYVFDTHGTTTGGDGKTYPDPRSYLTAANTSFIGESMNGVIITNTTPDATWDNGFGSACPLEGIGNGDVLIIEKSATDTYFQNLTIKTSMGDAHGRDIALHDRSNRTIFKDACLWGYQDTYVSNNQNGKFYFEGGVIRGRTDFLCGKGDLYCNQVTLRQVKSGYLAVPSVPKKYGYIFQNCKIVGDADGVDGTYTLGRPWGKGTPIALFINTEMEVRPSAIGWNEMSGGYPKRFAEYGSHTSKGVAIDLSGRKTVFGDGYENNPVLTAEEAAQYTLETVMGQDDQWQPTLFTEQAPVPSHVVLSGNTLTWDDNNYALLWTVCKDGNVVAFTTEPTYTVTTTGNYTVRAANEMGGLSAPSDPAVAGTGINDVKTEVMDASSDIYSLDGKRLSHLQHGLNIVRLNNGQVRKTVVW
jgi:lysophospholipase L1-like esterase